jgi:pimeloyl-ACP methyl ester carboxylesterase
MVSTDLKFAKSDGLKIAYRPADKVSTSREALRKALVAAACGGQINFTDIGDPVMQMDFRGQGGSEMPRSRDGYSVEGYAADMLAVASAAGVEKPILLGYSHAADGAAFAALDNPDRVRALVLVEPALFLDKAQLKTRLKLAEAGKLDEALRVTFKFANPRITEKELKAAVANAKEYYGGSGESFAGETSARLNSPINKERLAAIKVPTLVVGGTRSNIRANVARAAKAMPDASVVWIEGADHFLTGKSAQIMRLITAFVDSLD